MRATYSCSQVLRSTGGFAQELRGHPAERSMSQTAKPTWSSPLYITATTPWARRSGQPDSGSAFGYSSTSPISSSQRCAIGSPLKRSTSAAKDGTSRCEKTRSPHA